MRWRGLWIWGVLAASGAVAAEGGYDPLRVPEGFKAQIVDLTVSDPIRQRELPLRVYLPTAAAPAPVVLFSHGLGGSRYNNPYLGNHWAARGYAAVFVQHPGSDEAVWKEVPVWQRMGAMRQAASAQNFLLRARDIPVVLDQLAEWNKQAGHALAGRLDPSRIGMSGHSFGAVTTQAVSGQRFGKLGAAANEPRIRAAVLFSPSNPKLGTPAEGFGAVKIPWLLMTGTRDVAIVGDADVKSRLAVYPALPPGSKYELVLDGAEHSAFGDRSLPGESGQRNPNHHRVILALSTAFWDAYLRGDAAARAWLDGDGPRTVLEPADRWNHK